MDIEDLVEFSEDDREGDLLKRLFDLLWDGELYWYWSQNDSGDSVDLSRELEGVEVDTGLGLLYSWFLTCSKEIWAASWKIASGPLLESLADVST